MDLTASFAFIHNQSQIPLEGRTHRDQNLQSPTSSVSQLWSDPSPPPSLGPASAWPPKTKQQCCWLGVSIAAVRRLYLLWSAATYPGSFTTPMQCQLIAVTSCNFEQLLTSLNLWALPALCIWGQYVRRNYLMSEEKTWPWYICTAVKSHFLQTKQTNPFHSPPAGATTLLDVRTMCYFFSGKCLSYSMSSKCLAELFSPARNLTEQGNQVSLKPRICDRASLSQNSRCSVCVDLLRALEVFLDQLTPIQCPPILSRWWWSQADKMVEITPAQQMFRCSWSDPDG